MKVNFNRLKIFLDEIYDNIDRENFIKNDPIQIPHLFNVKQDIEIMGFITSLLSWGRRNIIIKKCYEIINFMDNEPYKFIINHTEKDLLIFNSFKHRTFNNYDIKNIIYALKQHYKKYSSLESVFTYPLQNSHNVIEHILNNFKVNWESNNFIIGHTKKHISAPFKGSACKRLNMFLRWMIRKDNKKIDFGIWNNIKPNFLICPVDLHVSKAAYQLGLISQINKYNKWNSALELTSKLRYIDNKDPIKYDIALFKIGLNNIKFF